MSFFPFQGIKTEQEKLDEHIKLGAEKVLSNIAILETEVNKFMKSTKRDWAIVGENYYEGNQDILNHVRTMIGEGGQKKAIHNLPNNKMLDNQYAKLVDQKVNYMIGKPMTIETDSEEYGKKLKQVFDRRFYRTFRNLGQVSLNGGIAWLYPYHDIDGKLRFKLFAAQDILPFWKDTDRIELEFAVRPYSEIVYEGDKEVQVDKVDVMTVNGVITYKWFNGKLIEDVESLPAPYITVADNESGEYLGWNWNKVPLIPFKFNYQEIPLIRRVKSLQDGINTMLSTFANNMQQDAHNTILVLYNYDGEDVGEFRQNLSEFGVVKLRRGDGLNGGLETLTVEVNSTNYKDILSLFKKALIENGRGYDSKDDRMSSNPNQMNIQSMYSDIELDANGIETEFQASFEELLWFINVHLANTGQGDFKDEEVRIIFNRDMLQNEKDIVETLNLSTFLSEETKIAMHPYVDDVKRELERKDAEAKKLVAELNQYNGAFPTEG